MEALIKQVNDYFVNKIIDEAFKIQAVREYDCTILIDNKYLFNIYFGSTDPIFFRTLVDNFMNLEFTKEQKETLYPIFKNYTKFNAKSILKEIKEHLSEQEQDPDCSSFSFENELYRVEFKTENYTRIIKGSHLDGTDGEPYFDKVIVKYELVSAEVFTDLLDKWIQEKINKELNELL